ncbi:MAG: DUF6067 family protein [Acidobacteriota bacterium]|nr:DUF6067 family protein [Acidobacteriota bacterium]
MMNIRTIGWIALLAGIAGGPGLSGPRNGGPDGWDAEALGNHRAVVRVAAACDAVRVRIPWRRRDLEPEKKAVIVTDAAGARIANVWPVSVERTAGVFIFQPAAGAGTYYFYYLPYRLTGSRNYPNARYLEPAKTAESAWLARHGLPAAAAETARLPEAQADGFESSSAFDSFEPMELIASPEETKSLRERFAGRPFLLFPEDRRNSIRMTGDLPFKWIQEGPRPDFSGDAARGEFYAFQVGVWACGSRLDDVTVEFSPLRSAEGESIPESALRCLNTGGTNWDGTPLRKAVVVEADKVQALWCGIQVPLACRPGRYEGQVFVRAAGLPVQSVHLILAVRSDLMADGGDSDPARLSRLRWLDSTLAMDDEVVKPFTPLTVDGQVLGCLGRTVSLGPGGLPAEIRSAFASDVTGLTKRGRDVLAAPMTLIVEDAVGRPLAWKTEGASFTRRSPGRVDWTFKSSSGGISLDGRAWMEMDGYLEFRVRLSSSAALAVKDVRLEIPWAAASAKYMMGLGAKGGLRPAVFQWTWDQKKNQDSLWLGDVNAGMQVGLRAENYSRPLNTNFYLSKPLNLPPSWWNGGRGSVTVRETKPGVVLYAASSGERTLEPGRDLHFDFILHLTPFKPIDPRSHFATRFMHAYKPLDEVAAAGANVVNVHHATAINPYINYPFLRPAEMKAYIDEARRRGFRVKIYDTIRELSNRAPEIFALRSLGHEIFTPGPGGGCAWLQEHLGSDYIPAWFVPDLKDAAVINSGMSRWHNYYIEGLDWLARVIGIDGLYLDDVAFDRTTMKRVRKVLDRHRPDALIDLHSANQYNPRDGFVSSATLYMEHFPYLNRLWFGEYFDYEGSPADYWLVEVSGIPFGLMGEMLQDGGNPWRGMVFGMTNRLPWSGRDPSRLWKVWDAFGLGEAKMTGWWADDCPVRADEPDVRATVYRKSGKAMIALASWAKGPVRTRLQVDWRALGLDPRRAKITAPEIPDFQMAASFAANEPIPFEPAKGWILIVE